jgi:hypothetical protein
MNGYKTQLNTIVVWDSFPSQPLYISISSLGKKWIDLKAVPRIENPFYGLLHILFSLLCIDKFLRLGLEYVV